MRFLKADNPNRTPLAVLFVSTLMCLAVLRLGLGGVSDTRLSADYSAEEILAASCPAENPANTQYSGTSCPYLQAHPWSWYSIVSVSRTQEAGEYIMLVVYGSGNCPASQTFALIWFSDSPEDVRRKKIDWDRAV
jgi:hypothetical protein